MASNRHLGRIVALQTLYEYEFRVQSGDASAVAHDILSRNLDPSDWGVRTPSPGRYRSSKGGH